MIRTRTAGRTAVATTMLSAAVLLLSACAPASSGNSNTADQVDTGAEIDAITVALPGSLSNLYVGQEAGILNYYVAAISQEGLVGLDADGTVVPALAESWTQPDDVTYVYELREDAAFQNGDPLTAEDVVFSIEQAQDETTSPGLSYYLSDVASAAVTGEHQVTVTLTTPNAAFLTNLSVAGALFVTQKSFWEAHDGTVGTADALTIGTGPYQVTEFAPDSHVTLERVDTWWGELPRVKTINISFIPDDNTRFLAAQKGDVDVAFNVPLTAVKQWESLDSLRVEYANDLSYVGLNFDLAVAPFDDQKVREAIAHSVDKKSTVDSLLRGRGEVATAIMTPESLSKAYDADEARTTLAEIPQYDFDLKKAKAALAASDHADGFTAEITYPSTGPQLGTAAQALAENLKDIGVTLDVREVPIEEWLATLGDGEHGVGFMWYFSTTGDPAEVPEYLLGAENLSKYDNADVQALLAEQRAEQDPAARIGLLVEAETQQAIDIVNVPLWWGQSATAFSATLGMHDVTPFAFLSSWPTAIYAGK